MPLNDTLAPQMPSDQPEELDLKDLPLAMPPDDVFAVRVHLAVIKRVKGKAAQVTIETNGHGLTQSEAVKEAVEAALAELKGKP